MEVNSLKKKRGTWFYHRANGPWEFADYRGWKANGKLYKVNRRSVSKATRQLIKRMSKQEIEE